MDARSGRHGEAQRRFLRFLAACCRDCRRAGQDFDADQERAFRRCVEAVRLRLAARGEAVAPPRSAPAQNRR